MGFTPIGVDPLFYKVGDEMLIMTMKELREYRLRYGVSQNAIAKKLNISRQYINQMELEIGKNANPSEDEKRRYLQALYEVVQARQEN